MVIEVYLHTILQHEVKTGIGRNMRINLPPGTTLAEVIEKFDIQLPSNDLLLVVNGRTANRNTVLNDGDVVHLIPALSGG